ncbi:hypothetical protein RI367_001413 [Sorochytrium milnesiophthora]
MFTSAFSFGSRGRADKAADTASFDVLSVSDNDEDKDALSSVNKTSNHQLLMTVLQRLDAIEATQNKVLQELSLLSQWLPCHSGSLPPPLPLLGSTAQLWSTAPPPAAATTSSPALSTPSRARTDSSISASSYLNVPMSGSPTTDAATAAASPDPDIPAKDELKQLTGLTEQDLDMASPRLAAAPLTPTMMEEVITRIRKDAEDQERARSAKSYVLFFVDGRSIQAHQGKDLVDFYPQKDASGNAKSATPFFIKKFAGSETFAKVKEAVQSRFLTGKKRQCTFWLFTKSQDSVYRPTIALPPDTGATTLSQIDKKWRSGGASHMRFYVQHSNFELALTKQLPLPQSPDSELKKWQLNFVKFYDPTTGKMKVVGHIRGSELFTFHQLAIHVCALEYVPVGEHPYSVYIEESYGPQPPIRLRKVNPESPVVLPHGSIATVVRGLSPEQKTAMAAQDPERPLTLFDHYELIRKCTKQPPPSRTFIQILHGVAQECEGLPVVGDCTPATHIQVICTPYSLFRTLLTQPTPDPGPALVGYTTFSLTVPKTYKVRKLIDKIERHPVVLFSKSQGERFRILATGTDPAALSEPSTKVIDVGHKVNSEYATLEAKGLTSTEAAADLSPEQKQQQKMVVDAITWRKSPNSKCAFEQYVAVYTLVRLVK